MSAEHHRHRAGDNPDAESVQDLKDEILGGQVAETAGSEAVPVGGQSEQGGSDSRGSESRGTERVDADRVDAEQSDAEQSDAEQSDAEQSDAEQSDGEQSDGEQSDGEQSDGEQSDGEQSDGEQGDAEQTAVDGADAEPEPPAAVLRATGLTLRTGQGPVFTGVDVTAAAGELVVLVGPAGSGRSSLLLSLTGRMSGVTGDLLVDGHGESESAAEARRIRAVTSVARIGTVVVPEPELTVAASITERAMIDGVSAAVGRTRFADAIRVLGADPDAIGDTTIGELSAFDRTVVTVALACVAPAVLIVLDDLDRDLSRADVADLTGRLARLTATGPALVATALDAPDHPGVTVVELAAPHPEGTAS